MAAALEPLLKTSVQVVNRPGAASEVGLTQLARSRPDGYTLSYVVMPTGVTHYLDPARAAIYTRGRCPRPSGGFAPGPHKGSEDPLTPLLFLAAQQPIY